MFLKSVPKKVGVIIPDRGDRPLFLANCLRMLSAQTLQPFAIEIVNDPPLSEKKDITYRYKVGYERLRNKGLDIIAFIENDDYYHPNYLQWMVNKWELEGMPEMLGCDFTIYYHIKLFAHFTMNHHFRSSAMNMLIKPDMYFNFGVDSDPYTDIYLWTNSILRGKIIHPPLICIGIKHNEGLFGGKNHVCKLDRYVNKDHDKSFLKENMDKVSFEFYSNYYR